MFCSGFTLLGRAVGLKKMCIRDRGWNVISIDGHNPDQIREALTAAGRETERPTLIIGRTVMGKGARGANGESFENKVSTHGQPLSAAGADIAATISNLGGNPDDPFAIFPQSRKLYEARAKELRNLSLIHISSQNMLPYCERPSFRLA